MELRHSTLRREGGEPEGANAPATESQEGAGGLQQVGRLRLRRKARAAGKWKLHVLCHNLRKLQNATMPVIAARPPTGGIQRSATDKLRPVEHADWGAKRERASSRQRQRGRVGSRDRGIRMPRVPLLRNGCRSGAVDSRSGGLSGHRTPHSRVHLDEGLERDQSHFPPRPCPLRRSGTDHHRSVRSRVSDSAPVPPYPVRR